MKIIDTHLHFWDLNNQINNWVIKQIDSPELKQNFLPDTLFTNKDLVGIVHVEAHDSAIPTIKEIVWLNNLMQKYPNIQYAHIAFADITLPLDKFVAIISEIRQYSCIKGIRHILSYNPKYTYSPCEEDLSKHEYIANNLQYLVDNNLIFDCQMYPYQLFNILPYIIKSGVTCIIDHLALPIWDNKHDQQIWENLIMELANVKHIFVKLSGLEMFQPETEFTAILDFCLQNIPIERLTFGTNYPVSYTSNYNYWFNYLNKSIKNNEAKAMIFYKNAAKLFFSQE